MVRRVGGIARPLHRQSIPLEAADDQPEGVDDLQLALLAYHEAPTWMTKEQG